MSTKITGEPLAWLEKKEAEHRELLESKAYSKFWPILFEQWFKDFPERKEMFPDVPEEVDLTEEQGRALGEAINKRQRKLQAWFRWRGNPTRVSRAANRHHPDLLTAITTSKPTRTRTKVELYSEMFYQDRVKPLVEAEAAAGKLNAPGAKLVAARTLCRDLLENEEEEVRKQIDELYEAEKKKRKSLSSGDDSAEETDPDAILAAIEDLPATLGQILTALSKKTGWTFSCMMAGPHPRRDWDITAATFHLGKTPMGCDFSVFRPTLEGELMRAYADFAEVVFSGRRRGPTEASASTGNSEGKMVEKGSGIIGAILDDSQLYRFSEAPSESHDASPASPAPPTSVNSALHPPLASNAPLMLATLMPASNALPASTPLIPASNAQ
ncbi:hypothetical protein HYDPIDRAFT_34617, partial [Hydnomerulius pinastri MD-312]